MILTEFSGKKLLESAGLLIPKNILVAGEDFGFGDGDFGLSNKNSSLSEAKKLNFPVFVKAQVLHGNREIQGLVKKVDKLEKLEKVVSEIFAKKDFYGQKITEVLIEESVDFSDPMYLGITYDTQTRTPVVSFSKQGGAGMDDRGDSLEVIPVSFTKELVEFSPMPELLPIVQKLIKVFSENDATTVEINPLVRVVGDNDAHNFYCLDSKIELESVAAFRHEEWEQYKGKTFVGRPKTAMEIKAHEISNMDHRGVAGESFFEFEGGDIGVMASGGGASVLAMDALLIEGLNPANYTEYSGNPVREKVKALTDLVLSIKDLKALYVVGSNANFTDIYETLSGVVDGLLGSSYVKGDDEQSRSAQKFKVLIRRGGPRWEEAFEMIEDRLGGEAGRNIEFKLFGPDFPIVKTASELRKMLESGAVSRENN